MVFVPFFTFRYVYTYYIFTKGSVTFAKIILKLPVIKIILK